mmetsp:Transcript_124810/g.278948  ORF Transcript_124810/g.278948 Transcript_124810/m.278948 type:complete len:226 (-) Transcript_124810:28-705(-)
MPEAMEAWRRPHLPQAPSEETATHLLATENAEWGAMGHEHVDTVGNGAPNLPPLGLWPLEGVADVALPYTLSPADAHGAAPDAEPPVLDAGVLQIHDVLRQRLEEGAPCLLRTVPGLPFVQQSIVVTGHKDHELIHLAGLIQPSEEVLEVLSQIAVAVVSHKISSMQQHIPWRQVHPAVVVMRVGDVHEADGSPKGAARWHGQRPRQLGDLSLQTRRQALRAACS